MSFRTLFSARWLKWPLLGLMLSLSACSHGGEEDGGGVGGGAAAGGLTWDEGNWDEATWQ